MAIAVVKLKVLVLGLAILAEANGLIVTPGGSGQEVVEQVKILTLMKHLNKLNFQYLLKSKMLKINIKYELILSCIVEIT